METRPLDCSREFHACFGLDLHETPSLLPLAAGRRRVAFIMEEVEEFRLAVEGGDLSAIAHELADVIYVAYGTAVSYGIDIDAVIREVHHANMTKLGSDGKPILREDGKVVKGPNYSPPDVSGALARQGWRP